MTSSPSGIYGNFGQVNYSSAKLGLLALAKTLAVEGDKYNIKCNTIVPVAASRLTEDLMPEDMLSLFDPKYVAPIVAYLSHETCPTNGDVFEAAGGFYGKYQWQRSKGKVFQDPNKVTIEDIQNSWKEIVDLSSGFSSPSSMQDHTFKLIGQLKGFSEEGEEESPSNQAVSNNPENNDQVVFNCTNNDMILYALSG